jgi:hypothetical protein
MAEIKRVGKAPAGPQADWTEWIHPNQVEINSLPQNVSIVYEIGSNDHGQLPSTKQDLAQGILYIGEGKRTIGEADSGKMIGRFLDLCKSWSKRDRTGKHESYRNWEDLDKQVQPDYFSIRVRYKEIARWSPLSWKSDVHPLRGVDDVAGRELAHLKEQQDRRDRSSIEELANCGMSLRPQTDYPYWEESRLLREFHEQHGRLPLLNSSAGDDSGPLVEDAWLQAHLADLKQRGL